MRQLNIENSAEGGCAKGTEKVKRKNWVDIHYIPMWISSFVCAVGALERQFLRVSACIGILGFSLTGCMYSFKGGSVPAHLRTIAIPIAADQSGFGDPALRDLFTQELTKRFRTDNSLELSDRNNADSMVDCVITGVKDVPNALAGGEQVTQRRLTVTVRATFQDLKLRKKIWEKDFSNYGDYDSGAGLTKRDVGIEEAVRKLTEDILNETVAGW